MSPHAMDKSSLHKKLKKVFYKSMELVHVTQLQPLCDMSLIPLQEDSYLYITCWRDKSIFLSITLASFMGTTHATTHNSTCKTWQKDAPR